MNWNEEAELFYKNQILTRYNPLVCERIRKFAEKHALMEGKIVVERHDVGMGEAIHCNASWRTSSSLEVE